MSRLHLETPIFLANPDLHIWILLGVQYVTPSFLHSTLEDRTVLTFSSEFRLRHLPATVEVNADWLTVQYAETPTITELDEALTTKGPGPARLPEATAKSGTVAVANVTIAPLLLVNPLLRSPFLTPVNTYNLVAERTASLVLDRKVNPLLY